MVTVCQTCGDRGFSMALIYCDKCQVYAVHRYCLYKLPKTFEEYVVWFCADCEPKVAAESSTLQQALPVTGCQLRLKKGSSVRNPKRKIGVKKLKNNKKNKKKSKYESGSLAMSNVQKQSSPSHQPPEDLEKDETLRKSFGVGKPNSNNEAILVEAISPPSSTYTHSRGLDWVKMDEDEEAESVSNRTSLVAANENLNIIEHNFLDPSWRELDGVYSDDAAECVNTKTSLVATSNQIPKDSYVPAQPIFEPIWRGSFCLNDENLTFEVIAHLSNLACLKVCETANCLPQLLHLELLPRCDVWPKGFRKWGPSEGSIALYFFSNNERETKILDNLVDKIIGQDLGMKAVVQDVELLVYTSTVLPLHFWRFQGKFYLWGVFRAKQASRSTNLVCGEEKNPMNASTWDSRSPVSTLSDRGSVLSG